MAEILTTYDRLLQLIVREKERQEITLKRMASYASCDPKMMSCYIYQGKLMPADVMFALLQALGYRIEVKR